MSRLKQIREQKNWTQEELSEKSGISVRTIQRIESGTIPKGYTLRSLANALEIQENVLLQGGIVAESKSDPEEEVFSNYTYIKLINLSSIPFSFFPPLNILIPLLLGHLLKQRNPLIRQMISLQLLWTILAPIVFFLGIFLKLGNQFTLVLIILIFASNFFMILRNTAEIDRNQKLYFKLNFNLL